MILKNSGGVDQSHGNDGNAAFFCQFKAAFMERQKGVFAFVTRTLREYTEGISVFPLSDPEQNRFQTLIDIVSVQKDTVDGIHPAA